MLYNTHMRKHQHIRSRKEGDVHGAIDRKASLPTANTLPPHGTILDASISASATNGVALPTEMKQIILPPVKPQIAVLPEVSKAINGSQNGSVPIEALGQAGSRGGITKMEQSMLP